MRRRKLGQSMRLMVGLPEYRTDVALMEATHPGEPMMAHEQFFRECQEARYANTQQRFGESSARSHRRGRIDCPAQAPSPPRPTPDKSAGKC